MNRILSGDGNKERGVSGVTACAPAPFDPGHPRRRRCYSNHIWSDHQQSNTFQRDILKKKKPEEKDKDKNTTYLCYVLCIFLSFFMFAVAGVLYTKYPNWHLFKPEKGEKRKGEKQRRKEKRVWSIVSKECDKQHVKYEKITFVYYFFCSRNKRRRE